MLTVTIAIPTYNRAEILRGTLASVAQMRVPEGVRASVLVVDNNSPDKTADVIDEAPSRPDLAVRGVRETTQGLPYARNRALKVSDADWIAYLDDDIRVSPDWLAGFAAAVDAESPDAVVGPVHPWFEVEPPSWITGLIHEDITSSYSRRGDKPVRVQQADQHELPGCNFAIRREQALALGGFSGRLGRNGKRQLSGEDFDYGERLCAAGGIVAYHPDCRIEHLVTRQKMSADGLRQRWYWRGVSARKAGVLGSVGAYHKARMLSRLVRFYRRARREKTTDPNSAFRWELEALQLRGSFGLPWSETSPLGRIVDLPAP